MTETANQSSSIPTRKITYASIASAIAFVVVFSIKQYVLPDMDDDLTAALLLIVTAAAGPAAGYLVAEWKDTESAEETSNN